MQTENKKEQYLEPKGFKGSKGKWYVLEREGLFPSVVLGDHPRSSFHKQPRIIINETDSAKEGSFEATAKLISQSKELAKALQDMIVGLVGLLPANVQADNPIHMTAYHAYHNAKKVLEQAGLKQD